MGPRSARFGPQAYRLNKMHPRHSALGTDELRDSLARELVGVCMSALKSCGVPEQTLRELARTATSTTIDTSLTNEILTDVYWMGELSNRWSDDRSYLDADGSPRTLPIRGAGATLESLGKEFFGDRPVDEIVELGLRTRVMERVGADSVALFSRCVMLTGDPCLLLAHSVRSIRWLLTNSRSNSRKQAARTNVWPERAAFAAIPTRDFEDFVKMMQPQIADLIDMADHWLTTRRQLKSYEGTSKKITAGVQAYVFRE